MYLDTLFSYLLYSLPYIEILYPCRTMGDRLGVAKASGNLGNTLKVMGKFKEAICCCERHLSISQELQDKVLYNYRFLCRLHEG